MNKKHLQFSFAYAIVFILVLVAHVKQLPLLKEITTPLITVVLLVFLSLATGLKGRFHQRLFTGLVFALTGDTLILMKSHDPSYFVYGLIALLISYIFYISAFYLDFRSAPELDKKGARIAIISCLVACISFYFLLRPHIGPYRLPVIIYAFIMALLIMMAAFRNERINKVSFTLVLAGAVLVTLSAASLSYSYFIDHFAYCELLVISTYMIGQYLIISGGVERKLLFNK